jgi:hypothetical protein
MCRTEFDKTVRPHVHEFPIGKQGIGFDRLELDAWADAYIAANSTDKCVPLGNVMHDSRTTFMVSNPSLRKSLPAPAPGHHTKSKEEFQKALESVRRKKQL